MEKSIRVFLESPKTLELASEASISKTRNTLKKISKRGKKKEKKLPAFVAIKSVYEEKDLSKLTERQRLLAIKFQSIGNKANSLFLAVHNIKSNEPDIKLAYNCEKCTEDCAKLYDFLTWLELKHSCEQKKRISRLLKSVCLLKDGKDCICEKERALYSKVIKILGLNCC